MNTVLGVYKPLAMTPLQMVDRFRIKFPEYKDEKISYAGRLDPMAEGVLPLLIGEANKERGKYLGLSKVYEFEILFGVGTDSFDVLGVVKNSKTQKLKNSKKARKLHNSINLVLEKFVGEIDQLYPPFSSRTVEGKPLWWWTREGRLDEVTLPSHVVEITELEMVGEIGLISSNDLFKQITKKVKRVEGDFRQDEILASWKDRLGGNEEEFQVVKCRVSCGTGMYVRQLVVDIGLELGLPTVAWSIKRVGVGKFEEGDALRI